MATQTGDSVVIGGETYALATDWGSGGGTGFTATHVQIVKTSWGDNYNTFRTSKVKPLPVQIFDGVQGTTGALIDGSSNALKITGGVNINQSLEIAGGQVNGQQKPMVSGIIQIVGPTFGKSGPTAYAPGLINSSNFAPVKVTGAIAGYSGAVEVGMTFGGGQPGRGPGEGLIRRLYGGPLAYTGATGYILTTHGAGTNSTVLDRDIDTIAIQGMHHGTPVGITGTTGGLNTRQLEFPKGFLPSAEDSTTPEGDRVGIVGIKGATAVEVTGGVRLSHMPAGGSFEIRNLSSGRDNVAVHGADGSTAAHVKIFDSNGQPLGVSGNGALKVAIDNGNFTGTVTLSTNVYIQNATGGALKVRGATGEHMVVKGPLQGGAIEVASPSGLNIRSLNASDKISIGGDVADNIDSLKRNITSINGKMNSMTNRVGEVEALMINVRDVVTNFQDNGTESDGDTIMFNTNNKRVEQPEELISLVISLSPTAKTLNNNTKIHNGVYIQADPANTDNVLVGGSNLIGGTNAGFILEPGENIFLQVANINKIYAKSVNGSQRISCIGS